MATNLHAHVMILYKKFMKISHWLAGCITTIAMAWLVMKPQPNLHPLVISHLFSDVHSCTTVNKHLDYIGIALPGSPRESSPTILHTISHNITTVMYACKLADQSYLVLNVCLGSSF